MARNSLQTALLFLALLLFPAAAFAASAKTSMRLLYPSFAGSWATAWIAKEAGYFLDEGLDVELIRVGGSTRMVAAMLGGSAPIIQAGAVAALTATAAGADVVIIGATGTVSPFRLMARPEIVQPAEGEKGGYHYLRVDFRSSAPHRVKKIQLGADQRRRYSYLRRPARSVRRFAERYSASGCLELPALPESGKVGHAGAGEFW